MSCQSLDSFSSLANLDISQLGKEDLKSIANVLLQCPQASKSPRIEVAADPVPSPSKATCTIMSSSLGLFKEVHSDVELIYPPYFFTVQSPEPCLFVLWWRFDGGRGRCYFKVDLKQTKFTLRMEIAPPSHKLLAKLPNISDIISLQGLWKIEWVIPFPAGLAVHVSASEFMKIEDDPSVFGFSAPLLLVEQAATF